MSMPVVELEKEDCGSPKVVDSDSFDDVDEDRLASSPEVVSTESVVDADENWLASSAEVVD